MKKYRVYMTNVISTSVIVEAENEDDAIDAAYDRVPGSVMFLNHTYPDMGDWDVDDDGVVEIEA